MVITNNFDRGISGERLAPVLLPPNSPQGGGFAMDVLEHAGLF